MKGRRPSIIVRNPRTGQKYWDSRTVKNIGIPGPVRNIGFHGRFRNIERHGPVGIKRSRDRSTFKDALTAQKYTTSSWVLTSKIAGLSTRWVSTAVKNPTGRRSQSANGGTQTFFRDFVKLSNFEKLWGQFLVHYPVRRLKYLLKMKQTLGMDYFGLNLKILEKKIWARRPDF